MMTLAQVRLEGEKHSIDASSAVLEDQITGSEVEVQGLRSSLVTTYLIRPNVPAMREPGFFLLV